MVPASHAPRRRRRSPDEAAAEIITAAEAFLLERPFRELSVDEVMRRTELSRPSFYVYFRDRHHLMLRVVEDIQRRLFAVSESFYRRAGDPLDAARTTLEGVVAVYAEHGPVLRALADAATDDPEVESAYRDLVFSFVEATTGLIEAEIDAGRISTLDARQTATALTLMNERYLGAAFGGREPALSREVATETLLTIWTRTLYGSGAELDAGAGADAARQSTAVRT